MTAAPAIDRGAADTRSVMEAAASLDVGIWARLNKVVLSNGKQFGFQDHGYQKEIYTALSRDPLVSVMKGSQVGLSEAAVLSGIHGCSYIWPRAAIYYFPTDVDVTSFSKMRFTPLLENNPETLGQLIRSGAVNDVHTKRIAGRAHFLFRGLKGKTSVKTVPADCLFFDELDEADPMQVEQALQRVAVSEYKWVRYFSTPTLPEFGVHEKYLKSDQRHRMYWCEGCAKYTCLETDWPDCILPTKDGPVRVCRHCKKPLGLNHPRNEWVPKFPGKMDGGMASTGYWLSQLQSIHVNLHQIWEEWERGPKYLDVFYNHVLAQPYVDARGRLEVGQVLALCGFQGMEHTSDEPCAIGIDVGPEEHHVVVGRLEPNGLIRVVYIGATDWVGLDSIMDRFKGIAVIDGLGETERARNWAKQHTTRAWCCFYTRNPKNPANFDNEKQEVTIYATAAMDRSHDLIMRGKIALPHRSDVVEEFAKHCHNVARKRIEDEETGEVQHTWVKLRADHYRRALNFMVLASDRTPAANYRAGDFSRKGKGSLLNPATRLSDTYRW